MRKLHQHPGERPTRRSMFPGERFITDEQARELAKTEQVWDERLLMFGFQQISLDKRVAREELRQDNMERLGMDRVTATKALVARKKR